MKVNPSSVFLKALVPLAFLTRSLTEYN